MELYQKIGNTFFMNIYVEELGIGAKVLVKGIINLERFEELYTNGYTEELNTRGRAGDAIGQGRWMIAIKIGDIIDLNEAWRLTH